MTLPLIQGLYKQWDEFPPLSLFGGVLAAQYKPKPMKEGIAQLGLPVRKGRVRKHGNISG